jgi:hypothetical protein
VLAAAVALLLPAGLTAAGAQTPQLTCSNAALPPGLSFPTVSSTLPFDATFSQNPSLDQVQQAFDLFSWASFVALNWPSNPDGTPMDGPITSNPTAPRVWEAYIEATGVFKPNGAPPDPWGGTNTFLASLVPEHKRGQKVLFAASKDVLSDIAQAGFGAATFPYISDLNNKYVFYEIHLNEPEYDYICDPSGRGEPCGTVSNNLYSKDGQTAFLAQPNATISFTQGSNPNKSYGAMEVKAAWKQLGAGDDPTKFYTVVATLIDPATGEQIPDQTMGLVGLHIITRTSFAPQWVWSTFEHVANAPDADPPPPPPFPQGVTVEPLVPGSHFSFNDANPQNQPPGGYGHEPSPWPLPAGEKPPENPGPTQITRVVNNVCINGAWTQALNSKMQAELAGTVWANYRLVSTQWPAGSGPTVPVGCASGVFCPGNLTNTTMETYVQNSPFSGSCMNCHRSAITAGTPQQSANFSYLLQKACPTTGCPPVTLPSRRQ